MASSSHSTTFAAPQSVDPFRDAGGFLPLVACSKCGTHLIGRVSQKTGSRGKRFYKCPLLEHTEYACGTYMWEEQYIEFLVKKGMLPRQCSQIRGPDSMATEVVKDAKMKMNDCQVVEASVDLLQSAVIHLRDSEAMLRALVEKQTTVVKEMEKLGDRLLLVGVAQIFVLVLVLLVLLVK